MEIEQMKKKLINLETVLMTLKNKNIIYYDYKKKEYKITKEQPSTYDMYYNKAQQELDSLEQSLGFEDIAIKQKKNICNSRLDVDISSEIIRGIRRPIPIIAANMPCVTNADFCIKLYELGALGVLHRMATNDILINETKKMKDKCGIYTAVSVGVGKDQEELVDKLIEAGAGIIFVDIAHGYSDSVINMGKYIKTKYKDDIKVVLGNTINPDMLVDCYDVADAIKCGIAMGSVCETKNTAGCTEKQFSAVYKFKYLSKKLGVPIISDGGIKEPSDLVKSIGAGANSIMAGKIFAMCPESAAELSYENGRPQKVYYGSASRMNQNKWRGGLKEGTCPEGKTVLLDLGESVEKLLERYSGALKSGITYAGGKDIKSYQNNVEFIKI